MNAWHQPPGMTGDSALLRVTSVMARRGDRDCAARVAAKARPGVWPRVRSAQAPAARPEFGFGPFMTALDLIEHRDLAEEAAVAQAAACRERGNLPAHPGLMEWTRPAVARYLAAAPAMACLPDGRTLQPASRAWVYQWNARDSGEVYEITAWGRRYRSRDGAARELRLPRLGTAGDRERSAAEVAVAAYVVAHGHPADPPERWSEQHRMLRDDDRVERVRVVEYGCADASVLVLFDGTPAEAEAAFQAVGKPVLGEVVGDERTHPGESCADCKLITICDTLPRVPGLLGITGTGQPLRTWSMTNGRNYVVCPARDHLRRLHLPRRDEYDERARRGMAVHAKIEELHSRLPHVPCSADDLLADLAEWQGERWRLGSEQAEVGARQLAQHLLVCPLATRAVAGQQSGDVRPERTFAVHDTLANVIVLAKPDLLYQDRGAWVWRETKTDQGIHARETDVMRLYPQAALAVLLLASGVLGGQQARSRVEVEVLHPDWPDVLLADPHDPSTVARAREVICGHAAQWHGDLLLDPRPGPWCGRCEVAQWCPARPALLTNSAEGERPAA